MEAEMGAPTFWDHSERAQRHIAKLNGLKKAVLPVVAFRKKVDDVGVMVELVEAASGAEQEMYAAELSDQVTAMVRELDAIEIGAFLTGQFDRNNAILSIQSGAGGTESNDWADILFRMYNRWAERRGFTVELQDVQLGEGRERLRLRESRARRPPAGAHQPVRRQQAPPHLVLRDRCDRRDQRGN
jgi:peptide chain release factor 2